MKDQTDMGNKGDHELAIDLKLDHILEKLTEVVSNVAGHDKTLFGENGNFGVSQKVQVMWRAHVWILCSLSAGVGSAITLLVTLWKK